MSLRVLSALLVSTLLSCVLGLPGQAAAADPVAEPAGAQGWVAVQADLFCPEGAESFGAPPPVASLMGCRLPDGTTLHGPYQAWHADGTLAALGMFEHGERVGEWTYWHANGQMAAYALYEAGEPAGGWLYWDERGELLPDSVLAAAD